MESRSFPGKFILPAKDGWWNWGMAPIYDEQGQLHIFNSSIPYKGERGMGDWLKKNGEAIYGTEAGPYPYEISWGTITRLVQKRK